MYLHYDPITTALLPYFLGLVYFFIFCWVRTELSPPPQLQLTATTRPEQVFQLLDDKPLQTTPKTARNPKSKNTISTGKGKPRANQQANLREIISIK